MTQGTSVSASRFDAHNSAVVARYDRAAHLGSRYFSTEVMAPQWEALKQTRPSWGKAHKLEFFASWDSKEWELWGLRPVRIRTVSPQTFNRGHIRIRAKVLEVKLRERATGRKGWVTVMHLPAHLQDGDRYTADPQYRDEVAAHKEALGNLGRLAIQRKRRHPDRWQMLVGDVNVDLFRVAWRAYLSRELHLSGMWHEGTLPTHGDMGRRLITGAWTYGVADVWGKVLLKQPAEKGLDHAMVLMVHQ